ncbi:hypothetical protein ABK040_010197 [Willaertia magna]
MMPMPFLRRSAGFINLIKSQEEDASNKEDNKYLNKQKKGLFIHSLKERFAMFIDKLKEFLISLVSLNQSKIQTTLNPFLSQLDTINCEIINNNHYNNLFDSYDILFIGKYVTFEDQKIIEKLQNLIELKKITIVFLNVTKDDLCFQLNYLNQNVTINNYIPNQMYQLNNSLLQKLIIKSETNILNEFYLKRFYNNFLENINIEIEYNNYFNKTYVTDDWLKLLQNNDGHCNLLLHKKYKILLSSIKENFFTNSNNYLIGDLFYYFVKFLLFDYSGYGCKRNDFKNKLFKCVKNCKLIDLEILAETTA